MSSTEVLLYQELDGTIPVLDWLKELQRTNKRAFEKCLFLLNLLEEFGHELRRPRADLLRDGVYELRTEVRNVRYRLLYGLVGKDVAVVAHGLTKEAKVPDRDIDLAASRIQLVRQSPQKYTWQQGKSSMTKKTTKALDLIRGETGVDPRTDPNVQAYRRPFEIAQMIYDARTAAGLTQQQLADLIGTKQPVISQLESADYEGQSLAMLERIADALHLDVQLRLVPAPTAR